MNDINFFSDLIKEKKLKWDKLSLLLFPIILLLLLIVYWLINQVQINKYISNINSLTYIAENIESVEKINKIKEKKDIVNKYYLTIDKLKEFQNIITDEDNITSKLLLGIIDNTPKSIILESVNISQYKINIKGLSKDKLSIAKFTENINRMNNIEELFLENILKEKDKYQFNLEIVLKGVMQFEEDADG